MAQRRMFSMKIINSARFLKMPVSSQLLYFHLGLQADDDGIVEAYNILRMTNCTEDDLKILVAKSFVIVLNEDLVAFITDWTEHNLIRPDRKVNSIYKDLLLQIVPDAELVSKRPRADSKKLISPPPEGQWTDNGQATDSIGKDRLGKDRLGEDSIGKDKIFPSDSDEYRLATYLWQYIKRNNNKANEPKLDKWAKSFDLMIRVDKRTVEDIKTTIAFCQQNDFWYKNILSPDKLRKHYEKLTVQMQEPKYSKGKTKSSQWTLPQSEYSSYNNMSDLEKKLLGWDNE